MYTDSTQEDFDKKFQANAANPAPYLQRSISAPAIAEHVSEAILPAYNYEDVDMQSSMLYQYGNNNPSRLNPRLPNAKKDNEGELDASYADLLDDSSSGILGSLISDSKLRTPLGLIQADFPSTPSSVFSNRLLVGENGEDAADATAAAGGATASAAPTADESLDQTSKSFSQLYVNSQTQDVSPKTAAAQPQTPLLSQYHTPMNTASASNVRGGGGGGGGGGFFPNGGNAPNGPAGGSDKNNSRLFNNAHYGGGPATGGEYQNTLLGNSPSAILNNGLNPLAAPVAPNAGGPPNAGVNPNAGANPHHPQVPAGGVQQQQQQVQQQQGPPTGVPAYYVQQAVYLDQNGQPIFYRPGQGQYGQEFMYPPTGPDGNPIGGDQLQGGFVPYNNGQGMNQNMPPPQYWSPQGPEHGGMQLPIYMGGPQPGGPGGMDGGRRMVYNPATGQYNSIQGGMGGGPGGRNGPPMGAYGMQQGGLNHQGLPNLMPPRNNMNQDDMFRHDDRGMGGGGGRGGDMHDMYDRRGGGGGGGGGYRDDRDRRDRGDRDGRGRGGGGGGGGMGGGAGVNPVRDSLVEEFRSTYGKSRQWGLRDLLGHVVAFCQDQHGSRFIQQRLEVCSDVDKQLIFDEILPAAQSLMTDVFGNYVLQKLFEYGTADQCESLALLLKGQSVQLAMQMYGCRVVQKALEYVSTQRLIDLVTEFESPPLLLRCVHDSNGNHVIQKCIEIVSKVAKEANTPEMSEYLSGRIQFIIVAFQGRVKELSSHPYGCRVVQRILEHCSNAQKAVILEELRQCCTDLVQDCYGNYVIQFVMQHGWEADRAVLIREVQSNLLDFSQHKFASNVVEKCLQYANKKDRDEMIWTIINVTFDLKNPVDAKGHCVLESMVRDPYANYVVQKVIDVSDERQRAAIMRYVKENITQLRRYTYGKHIIVRLEKITNEKF